MNVTGLEPKLERELRALRELSARIGADPMLVQGPGGNTSLKTDDEVIVKASGAWLRDARERNVFVRMPLDAVRRTTSDDDLRRVPCAALDGRARARPSIEATLHAELPHTVVVHVHCVDAIAWAVRRDAPQRFAERLHDLAWGFVPYVKPGARLRDEVRGLLARRPVDVLVLGNHGLVVGAATCEDAAALLETVRARIRVCLPGGPAPDLRDLEAHARRHGLRLPRHVETHRTALDPNAMGVALGGSLYPDHVVFLGPGVACEGERDADGVSPRIVLLPGRGVLVAPQLDRTGEEMARALAWVTSRIPVDAPVRYLTREEEAELLDWDAERYRQSLAR